MAGVFSERIDLEVAKGRLVGSQDKHKRFPGLIYRLKSSKATFLLFKSGSFVCTGSISKAKGEEAIVAMLGLLKELELVSNNCTFECGVKNLVASVRLGGASVNLERFDNKFDDAVYEPDKFPAVVYQVEGTSVTFLVFLSGTIICSGISNEELLTETVNKFCEQLNEKNVLEQILS